MKRNLIKVILFQLLFPVFITVMAQEAYKVEYRNLPSELLTGNTPTICILEDEASGLKLFDKLSEYGDIKRKFNCYSTENIKENKDLLKTESFNPEDKDFLNALNEQLSIEYVLVWKAVADSPGVYQLSVYSTKNHNQLYSSRIYSTINSNPALDVNKLLVANLEPVYYPASGEIEVVSKPDTVHLRLYKGNKLVKEWTGKGKQKIDAGKYQLTSEALGYLKEKKDIEITPDKLTSVKLDMKEDLSLYPNVYSTDKKITNIRLKPGNEGLTILYDLTGEKDEDYSIKLMLVDTLTKKPTTELKQVSGDITDVKPKQNNKVIWQYKKDLDKNAVLPNYYVQILTVEKGGTPWYYYAGGAVVGIGAAAILLGKKGSGGGDGTASDRTKIQPPPVRP